MKLTYPILLLSIAMLMSCGQRSFAPAASTLIPKNDFTLAQVDTLVKYLERLPNRSQIACVIIQDSVPRFYGVLREKDMLIPVDNRNAVFEIGSISKVFTSTLLAQQVQQGKIQLEEPINAYLPYTLKDNIPLTFQQLSNHTSGLPRVPTDMARDIIFNRSNPYKNYDTTRLRKYLSEKLEMDETPGETFGYSNLGAGLLGLTLENNTGKTYEAQLQEHIFIPYGMKQSTTQREQAGIQLVTGLNPNGKPTPNWDLMALAGAGAIVSSAEDLTKFALAQFDEQDQMLALTRKMTYRRGDLGGVGLGWFIQNAKSGGPMYWHNGGTGGYKSFLMIDPASQNGVIVLSNCSAFSDQSPKIDELGQALLNSVN